MAQDPNSAQKSVDASKAASTGSQTNNGNSPNSSSPRRDPITGKLIVGRSLSPQRSYAEGTSTAGASQKQSSPQGSPKVSPQAKPEASPANANAQVSTRSHSPRRTPSPQGSRELMQPAQKQASIGEQPVVTQPVASTPAKKLSPAELAALAIKTGGMIAVAGRRESFRVGDNASNPNNAAAGTVVLPAVSIANASLPPLVPKTGSNPKEGNGKSESPKQGTSPKEGASKEGTSPSESPKRDRAGSHRRSSSRSLELPQALRDEQADKALEAANMAREPARLKSLVISGEHNPDVHVIKGADGTQQTFIQRQFSRESEGSSSPRPDRRSFDLGKPSSRRGSKNDLSDAAVGQTPDAQKEMSAQAVLDALIKSGAISPEQIAALQGQAAKPANPAPANANTSSSGPEQQPAGKSVLYTVAQGNVKRSSFSRQDVTGDLGVDSDDESQQSKKSGTEEPKKAAKNVIFTGAQGSVHRRTLSRQGASLLKDVKAELKPTTPSDDVTKNPDNAHQLMQAGAQPQSPVAAPMMMLSSAGQGLTQPAGSDAGVEAQAPNSSPKSAENGAPAQAVQGAVQGDQAPAGGKSPRRTPPPLPASYQKTANASFKRFASGS